MAVIIDGATGAITGALAFPAPEAHTSDDILTPAETGSCHTNEGAEDVVTLALPPATPGLHYWASVEAAEELRLDPDGNETICLPSTGVPGAAGAYLVAAVVGACVHLVCVVVGSWRVAGYSGSWTAEE